MFRRIRLVMLLVLFVLSVCASFLYIQPAKADGTIYIRADGSIDPPTANITSTDNLTYTFTGNVSSEGCGIIVEKDNIVVDGADYILQGTGVHYCEGIDLSGRSNVTIKNTTIDNFWMGISVFLSNNNRIVGNNITNNEDVGILLSTGSSNNTISGNNIANNGQGLTFFNSLENTVYHNNFINNTQQVSYYESGPNVLDDGYPSGGNYWSDYNGTDANHDGIGDTPYIINENNTDNYPLMKPYVPLLGDINRDDKVDMRDVGYVSRRFMCVPGDGLWDSNADLNGDDQINMIDIGLVARHFGEHYP